MKYIGIFGGCLVAGGYYSPKNFHIDVSTTGTNVNDFTTVLEVTYVDTEVDDWSMQAQWFELPDVADARYIKLVIDNSQQDYSGATNPNVQVAEFYAIGPQGDTVVTYIHLNVFLEGPFNGFNMNTLINSNGILPLSQPYNIAPWNYTGTESIVSEPNTNIVDWVLVELRDTTEAQYASGETMIARQAAFVLNDGSIVGLDGVSNLQFNNSIIHQLFIVIWHRNHLGVMSAYPLTETGGVYNYDFTTGADEAYGGANGHKEIGTGIWGMIAADGNADGYVNLLDKDDIWKQQAGEKGYKSGDYNLNGQVNNPEKNDFWVPNEGSGSQVPE